MEFIFFIMGLVAGGVISYFVVGLYYERTGRNLKDRVVKLQELNIRMLSKMEEAGLIKWNRDIRGHIVGMDIRSESEAKTTEEAVEDRTLH